MQYFGYGEMKSTDVTGSVTGTFSPKDICFSGTYSHDITTALRGGVTLKGVYSDYEAYSAFALAVDLGLNYYDGDNDMSLSLVVTNLGGQLKRFNEVYERLPVDVRIGWSQGLHGLPFRLSVTAWNLTRWHLLTMTQATAQATIALNSRTRSCPIFCVTSSLPESMNLTRTST